LKWGALPVTIEAVPRTDNVISLWNRLTTDEKLNVLEKMIGTSFMLVSHEGSSYFTFVGNDVNFTNGSAMLKALEDNFNGSLY
jgi:hypothetical protein